jgi:hypothetical protein
VNVICVTASRIFFVSACLYRSVDQRRGAHKTLERDYQRHRVSNVTFESLKELRRNVTTARRNVQRILPPISAAALAA